MVDLGGYIIILINDNGKIKLYGSSADNADNPEVGDEILEVNGRTLENATDTEVSQYIHQCIKSGTISLQVTRRTGNKMKELDGPNADRIRDAWVIALERGARERLQKLPALRKIQPRDIQAILHQQITDGSASTSTDETPKKDITNSHITVTLADREAASRNAVPAKLSNGTVPKGVAKEDEDTKDRKDVLEKQRSCPEETNRLQPVPGVRVGERRASSPFQNGRTEVLIGEPEGTPRSPRGSTSSATNDANLLIPPGDPAYPESIYKSRRRSTSGVNDIHLQPSQLQENNNGGSRDNVKGGGGGESRDSRVESTGGPNEMWAPGSSPGHNRELPVDVPDSLLQQAYANKQVMSLMLNRSETAFWSASTSPRNRRHLTTDEADDTCIGNRRASDHEISDNDHHHHLHHHHNHQKRHQSNRLSLNVKTNISCVDDNDTTSSGFVDTDRVDNTFEVPTRVDGKDDNQNDRQRSDKDKTLARIIEMNVLNEKEMAATLANNKMADEKRTVSATSADEDQKLKVTIPLEKIHPFEITDDEDDVVTTDSPSLSSMTRNGVSSPTAILMQKETSVDADEDYPFAKEDYPTMLKTCSDDSASPRSSSGRSDSTALLDSSLIMAGKESPLYDARRIDLGSPCRPLVPEIKIAPIFTRGRETTSFDNPAYGLADLHDLHQGLLMRSDEVTDLTRLIDEQQSIANGRKSRPNEKTNASSPRWSTPVKDHTLHRQPIKSETTTRPSEPTKTKKKSTSKRQNEAERLKSRGSRDSDMEIDSEGLLGAGSTDDLLSGELTNLTITRSNRKKKGQQLHSSSGYSTLRSDASIGEFSDRQPDRSFLVVGNRSYREVAVDCPPDFVPVTKCHPVYPPPNKTDNTIERNSTIHNLQMDRLSRHVDDTTTFFPEYGRRDSASNLRLNWYARDATLTKNTTDSRNAKDEKSLDRAGNTMTIQHEKQRQHVKTDDVRNNEVVSDLGGIHETRREKVRSRVKSRVLRYKARLSSIGRKSTNTLVHASSGKDGESSKARIFAKHSFTASSNNSSTNACKITSYSDTTTGRSGLTILSNNQSVSSNESFDSSKYSNSQAKLGPRAQNDYVNDRIPRRRSILNLMQRETNENSRNSLLELVGRRDSTPVIVYYSSKIDNALFVDNELRRSTIDNDYRVNDRTNEMKSFSRVDGVEPHDETVRLENTQNSLLSLEYRRNNEDDVTKDSDDLSICKKLFDDSTSSDDTDKFIKKCLSETNLYRENNDEKFIIGTRLWLSEPYLDLYRFTRNFTLYDFIEKRAKTNELAKIGETVLTRQDVNDDETKEHRETTAQPGLNGVKPAIPPRDQKRAPARPPKDNVQLLTRNNNIEQTDNANTPELTQQQLHSIRKYQEQFRKRKEGDERQEYLNRSLRDSRKLQALESHTTTLPGQENPAYSQDEVTNTTPRSTHGTPGQTTPREVEEPPKVLTYGEVVATLERLQLQLRDLSGALGISGPGVEAELEAVRTLLVQRRFATALATHHALRTRLRTGKPLKHHHDDASNLARDCVEVLEEWQTTNVGSGETRTMVEELTVLLTSYEIEGLLLAHDSIVSYVDGVQRKTSPSSSSPSRSPSPSSSLRGTRNTDNIKIIRIEKTNEPLGATVRNEGDAVIIGRVVRGGAADKSGLFHEGDEVLEVNGVEMRGKSVNEVCDILAGMQGGLTFLVLPASTNQRNNVTNTRREDSAQIHHVRAHFDYDPEEDPYIPCRELGVSFQKGDVLHVISQEDSNWWQAYREGEEDHTLAGLIPSRAFQHQRESIKQTFAGGKSTIRSSKKSSTLLCTRKNPKKKKKRAKFGPNFNDEGYPLYTTTTIDDYDSEEVLTYEEVALYYPRANHKRPIVLIGPPNIGRHELRQRLMQDSERFAAAIPHTSRPRKGSEVDGQDYHFISRSQFESDILGRKFVEHGEYEKAYYGTSVEAIRSVVNSGKICVLNLHPQSLKILRSSDLKPYVVFVAPPSLEKLRQKRIKNNESFKEEELKDIIEKAREMEDKYGHLFDMIILNNDTDRAYNQLLGEINSLEREPQWVPATWIQ